MHHILFFLEKLFSWPNNHEHINKLETPLIHNWVNKVHLGNLSCKPSYYSLVTVGAPPEPE